MEALAPDPSTGFVTGAGVPVECSRSPAATDTFRQATSYRLPRDGTTFTDFGGDFFDRRDQDAVKPRLVARLEALGNNVNLEKIEGVA
jgi:hypothetical protein